MIASTLVAAALASTSPAQAAPAAPAHHHAAMAASGARSVPNQAMAGHGGHAEAKMDCCKDGCACCAKKDAAKAETAPAR
ncbi:MAG: hypothetical protein M3Q83_04645 [Pseudomonadota bacterium]|nr:hypothetical protein [Pseudomonadota bacterium]